MGRQGWKGPTGQSRPWVRAGFEYFWQDEGRIFPALAKGAMRGAMLKISDITYAVEGRPLFEGASAVIPDGHKVGVIGRNGAGKTTLFRLIRGELSLESGAITLPAGARIGGVAQEVPGNEVSLIDMVLSNWN